MQVEEDRVGLVPGDELDRLLPVRGGRHDLDARQPAEQQDQALADAGLVVGHDDAQRRRGFVHWLLFPLTGVPVTDVVARGPVAFAAGASGRSASTTHWPSRHPASRVPRSRSSRSRIPVRP